MGRRVIQLFHFDGLSNSIIDLLQWRAKVLSIKFLINLVIGALALMTARYFLSTGAGFEAVMRVISIAACFIVGAAILLPNRHAFPTVKS